MKLAEAANILGVHPDTPIETLKQTYRRLALAWHPDKCSNPNAKEKFQQISIAYTKLISAKCIGGRRLEDENSDDTSSGKRSVDSHEMAAFMRMFMDLVGIFNEDQSLSEDGKIPAAGVSFGMMFGSRPGTSDEWSTEDEADPEELDDEDDDDEEDDDDCYGSDDEGPNADGTTWEPPAKHYSQMNLKEEASKERQSKLCEETEKGNELLEAKRKLKNAKKRAEKRRKQREKKTREAAIKEDEEEELRQIEETKKREEEEAQSKLENNLRLQMEAKAKQRVDLFDVLRSGNITKVKCFIGDTLETVKSSKSTASGSSQLRARVMRDLFATQPLLHCCVGEPSSHLAGKEGSKILGEGRLAVAKYLLGQRTRPLDLGITDDDGRTALHLAAKREDPAMIRLLLAAREENPDRKAQLDLNARCRKSGWTPLHYASSQGDVPSLKLLLEAGASLVVHAGSGKGATPLEVVKSRLQNAGHFSAAHIANLQQVAKELSEGMKNLEKVKHQKEAERLLKEEKLEAAKKKLAEREEKEKELLERKQKQLKEKQDRDRQRDEEESNKKPLKATPAPSSTAPVSKGSTTPVSTPHTPTAPPSTLQATKPLAVSASAFAESSTSTVDNNIKMSKKKLKKDRKKEEEEVPAPPLVPAVPKIVAVVDVASRDELVDHLLAMGFPEPDCLTAISLYGKDLDRALSWLCDRPPAVPSATAPSSNGPAVCASAAVSATANPRQEGNGSVSLTQSPAQRSESLRLQKEKDHKEELRRINRAWNQKAEDEKRRADAEKKQKEDERQKDGHLQQVLLKQQQQQQLLQQQHLHQLLAQHQLQQQRSQLQQQVLQRTSGIPGFGYGIPPKSDVEPPPMSFTGSVAPGTRQFQNTIGQPSPMHNQSIDSHPIRTELNVGYMQTRSGSPNVINPLGSNIYQHNLMGLNGARISNMGSHEYDLSQRDELKGNSRSINSTLSAYNELQIQSRIRAASITGNPLSQSISSNSLQYDPQAYSNTTNGQSQSRVLHQLPYSQTQQGNQHFLPLAQTLGQTLGQGPPPMRPIATGQSPLSWDDNARLRSIDPSPPGQSQQVFQSQQQLQEQESSRLHHQSQSRQYQYVTNDTNGDEDEYVDNSLELSIKAKPFVPQYSKSPASSLPMPPPMTQGLKMSTLQLSHQPQSYLNSNSSAAVLGGLPVSNSMSDPWGSVPTQTHTAQHGQRSQVFEKHSGGFNMPMLSALSPINAPTLGGPGSLQSLSSQSSPYSAILRSFSSDRVLDSDVRASNGSHSGYPSNLGGPLLQDLGSIDNYGSNMVDDLERDDSYPDAIPSILSSLLMHKSSTSGLGSSAGGSGSGSARGLVSDRYQGDSNESRDMTFSRDRGGQTIFRDQGVVPQSGLTDMFESDSGFVSNAFGGRQGSFLSRHIVSNNQDSIAGLMRGAGQTFQAER